MVELISQELDAPRACQMHIIFAFLETDIQQPLRVSVAQKKSVDRRGWNRWLGSPEVFV